MSLLSFNFNINLIYVLIYWIIEIFLRTAMYYKPEYFTVSNDPKENEYMFILFPVISKLFSGFIVLYVYCTLYKKRKRKIQCCRCCPKMFLIYKNPIKKKENIKYYYLNLLFITCLEIVVVSFYFIYFWIINADKEEVSVKHSKDVLTLMDILVRYIFSIVILKVKTFKHHKCSIYAMIFAFVLIIPFDVLDVYYEEKINTYLTGVYVFILSVQSILYPLEDTYIKKFFNSFYILPEKMLFSMATLEAIILTVITLLLYFFDVIKFNLIYNFEVIISISIFILFTAVKEFILMKIIYLYSSQSISFLIISQNISVSLIDIIYFVKERNKSDIKFHVIISFPFEIIALFIIILATSVYDEIVVINKWDLNSNIKRGISERADLDYESVSNDDSETVDENFENNPINK